ncbi:MAG: hypothetical protein JWM58_2983 [Rhizobium sp.]|nr:hypothetical protein [Rhizobium sp.]
MVKSQNCGIQSLFRIHIVPKTVEIVYFANSRQGDVLPAVDMRMADVQVEIDTHVKGGAGTIVLADCRGVEDLQRLDMALSVAEARAGRNAGGVRIIASAADSAAGLLGLVSLGGKSTRLVGLTWSRSSFCRDVGCTSGSEVAEHARLQLIVAARAFSLPAYDSRDTDTDTEDDFVSTSMSLGFDGYSTGND